MDIYIGMGTRGVEIRTNKGFVSISRLGSDKITDIMNSLFSLFSFRDNKEINFIVEPLGIGMAIIEILESHGYKPTYHKKVLVENIKEII